MTFALALHGGAGVIADMEPDLEAAYLQSLKACLAQGVASLAEGASALDTVEAVIATLEDDPLFNAGRGAVYHAGGGHELDAALMDGHSLRAGGVACLTGFANPIRIARRVMDTTRHLLLAGEGARQFALEQGFKESPPEYFHSQQRRRQLETARRHDAVTLDHAGLGTVGAVALDLEGNLAAGSSTGGMTNKLPGRVGDSPLVGAGLYADNRTCAVTCTGIGEEFMRHCGAHRVCDLVEFGGLDLSQACRDLVEGRMSPGQGGLIAVDPRGNLVAMFNTRGMFRGLAKGTGLREVAIW